MSRIATLHRSFPTLVMLGAPLRWIGKSRRRICGATLLLLAIIASPSLWWATQLVGLPEIDDPFDVAEFRAFTVPEDRNAFVLYSRAATLFNANPGDLKRGNGNVDMLPRWSQADPEIRRWAEQNREALEVYRKGTERPDALDPAIGSDRENLKTVGALWSLRLLALLEASRLEEQDDMAGAWRWYRAVLRTIHHVGMHASFERRNLILRWHRELHNRLTTWADDRRTAPALLRRALDDVVACEELAPSERDSLKAGFLEVMSLLDGPSNPGRAVPLARFRRFWNPNYTLNPEQIQGVWNAWRFCRREPERSRRIVRLVTANWLAYLNMPVGDRPKPDPKVASFDLYSFGQQSPAQARALSPEALERWINSAYDAQKVLHYLVGNGIPIVERANHADLLVLLGAALYHRDHGSDPPTPEALVGPYLKSLPAEFFDKKTQFDRSMNELEWWRKRRSANDKSR
jgi:hypothetical protein